MFGWIHESFRQLVNRKYGRDVWLKIVALAGFEEGTESEIAHYYTDEETLRLANTMASTIGIPLEEVWEAYGCFLIQFTMETGWNELLRAMASDLKGFLDSLDSLHYFVDHVVYKTKLRGPSFCCEAQVDGTLILHYYSTRSGLYNIVKGVVREVARRIYDTDIIIKIQERKQEQSGDCVTEHVVFVITQVDTGTGNSPKAISTMPEQLEGKAGAFDISLDDFSTAFPYHVCFDKDLFIEHCGDFIINAYPMVTLKKTKVTEIFELVHPEVPFSYHTILSHRNSHFVFEMKRIGGSMYKMKEEKPIYVKGSMVLVDGGNYILYISSLFFSTIRELIERDLHITDMQQHDGTRDLIMLNQSRMSQVELKRGTLFIAPQAIFIVFVRLSLGEKYYRNLSALSAVKLSCDGTDYKLRRKLEETTKSLKKMANELENEKQRTDELLCELMPASIADALRHGREVEASDFSECTLLFTDIVTFTNICAACTPYDVVTMLNDLYLRFDRLIELIQNFERAKLESQVEMLLEGLFVIIYGSVLAKRIKQATCGEYTGILFGILWVTQHGVYKVETIGDAYMVVGGVPDPCDNHSERVLNVSIGLLMESKLVLSPVSHKPIRIRLGVHSGPVVAGVVGVKMPRYCLFGDSVSVANKMESSGVPARIHVSKSAMSNALESNPKFVFADRGMTEIKGKEPMYTYFLERNDQKSVWELCARPRSGEQTMDGYMELHDMSIYTEGGKNPSLLKRRGSHPKHRIGADPTTNHVRSPTCVLL